MIYAVACLIGLVAFWIGYLVGVKKATNSYSEQIRDIIVAALSADFSEGKEND